MASIWCALSAVRHSPIFSPHSAASAFARLHAGKQGSRAGPAARPRFAVKCSANADIPAIELSRRQLVLATLAGALGSATLAGPAHAGVAYNLQKDAQDGYQFAYPFGWQEDVVFKDVIEPLESVAVNIIPTDRKSLREIGPVQAVATTLVKEVLTNPVQQAQLVKAVEKEEDGKLYYVFEFTAKSKTYSQHRLGAIAIRDGRFYTITTGANERRWPKMEKQLRQTIDSFKLLY